MLLVGLNVWRVIETRIIILTARYLSQVNFHLFWFDFGMRFANDKF